MRRRMAIAVTALSALCLLVALAGMASAAAKSKSKSKSKTPGVMTVRTRCTTNTTIAVANGDLSVLPPVTDGTAWGFANCPKVGSGIERDKFTVPDSGNTEAKFQMYFPSGTASGTYELVPNSDQLNFLAASWTGTMKVLHGTGALKGITGTGTMTCSSPDQVHILCHDSLKLAVVKPAK